MPSAVVTALLGSTETKTCSRGRGFEVVEDCQPSTLFCEGKEMFELEKEVGTMLPELLGADVHHVEPVDGGVGGGEEEDAFGHQLVSSCPANLEIIQLLNGNNSIVKISKGHHLTPTCW